MQHKLLFAFILFCFLGVSQTVPQKINYQGIARSATGNPFVNQALSVKFQILQGSAAGSPVFTETQNLTTNSLGLFNTQIGNVNTTGLGTINWGANNYFLEISIDTTGGTAFVLVGTQQLVSVPYALYSASSASAAFAPAPAVSLSGTVLSVGANTVGLPQSPATPSTSIVTSGAIGSTLTGNTYSLDAPQVTLSPTLAYGPSPTQTVGGLAQVIGSYPNFTILVAPVINYDPNSGDLSFTSPPLLTPTYGYTYNILPSLSITGNTLSVGTNSVLLPGSSSTASLVSGGAATTATLGSNSYSINVPVPVITGSNAAVVSGSYPSWTINVPNNASTASLVSTGAATTATLGPNSYSINVPVPVITGSNAATISGSYPNWTINVPNASTASLVSSGAAATATLGPNSYSINVPVPVITGSNAASVSGSYPNWTVNVPATPTVSIVHNVTGLAEVSGTYPNYIVTVAPNFTYMNSSGYLVITNTATGSSYSFNITPTLVYNPATGVLTNGPASNSVTIPVAVTPSMTGTGAASVNPSSGNSFTVNVPQTSILSSNNTATISPAGTNSFDIIVPAAVNLTATAGSTLTGTYPNYTVTSPAKLNLTTAGATTLGGTYPNLNVGTPMVTLTGGTTVFGNPVPSGLAQVMGSYPNYSLVVSPIIAYNPTVGILSLSSVPFTSPAYSYTYNITPSIGVSNNVITSGPPTNTVAIVSPAAQAFAVSGTALLVSNAGASLFGTSFTKQSATSEIDLFLHAQVNVGAFQVLGTQVVFELLVDGNVATVSTPHYLPDNTQQYITLRSIFSGLTAGPHTVSVQVRTLTGVLLSCGLDPNNYGAKLILKETY